MRDLLDEDGENRAVRTFLQLIYGGTTSSITTERMRNHLAVSGWEANFVPDWAEENMTLTKAGVQMWLRHLLNMETKNVIEACPFKVGDAIEVKEPNVWKDGYFAVLLDPNLTVAAIRSVGTEGNRFHIQTDPPIIPVKDSTNNWADFNHFKLKEETKPVVLGIDWTNPPPKFVQHLYVQHVKTKGVYLIEATPDECKIEATGEPAYSYRNLVFDETDNCFRKGNEVWVRGQANMEEEGRFKPYTNSDTVKFEKTEVPRHSRLFREELKDTIESIVANNPDAYFNAWVNGKSIDAATNKRIGEIPIDYFQSVTEDKVNKEK